MSLNGDMNKSKMKNPKDRQVTEIKLQKAIAQVLSENGFGKLGVNAVAKKAGVDKVLIYRYFGDLNGLMKAYAQSSDFWPSPAELLGENDQLDKLIAMPFSMAFAEVFQRYANAIRTRPLTLEILSWETIERNALTIALEEVRESTGLELTAFLSKMNPPSADWLAIINIFASAIHYLAIRSRKIKTFTGMDISSDEGWSRLNRSIQFIATSIESHESSEKNKS